MTKRFLQTIVVVAIPCLMASSAPDPRTGDCGMCLSCGSQFSHNDGPWPPAPSGEIDFWPDHAQPNCVNWSCNVHSGCGGPDRILARLLQEGPAAFDAIAEDAPDQVRIIEQGYAVEVLGCNDDVYARLPVAALDR